MNQDVGKRAAGEAAMAYVRDGMTLGLGSGSTTRRFVLALGERVRSGLNIRGVPTSNATQALAVELGIRVVDLGADGVDITVDGADAVDDRMSLIKGLGGALVRERIVAAAAKKFVVVVDESKRCSSLQGRVPVELVDFGVERTLAVLGAIGGDFAIRRDSAGNVVRSDNGNVLADGHFGVIDDPLALGNAIAAVPGVVGHGLFVGMADVIVVGRWNGGVEVVER